MVLTIFIATALLAGIQCQPPASKDRDFFDYILQVNQLGSDDSVFSANKINETLMEGDIVVTEKLLGDIAIMEQQAESGIATFDAIRGGTWKNKFVPYTFQTPTDKKYLWPHVKKAIAIYDKALGKCITWKYMDPSSIRRYKNHIIFFRGGGCYSMIGMQRSGPQKISLQYPGCTYQVGTVVHEMMHALGFFHEQSRLDRDQYISIYWNNINKRMWYNFKKYRSGEADTFNEPYDKQSVMHYGGTAFSIDGRKRTIVSKANYNEKLGQRVGLSTIDIKQLKKYYKCGGTTTTTTGGGGGGGGGSTCSDKYTFCKLLTTVCTHTFVRTNCKKTCGKCPPPVVKKTCADSHRFCNSWKASGFCNNNSPYKDYMIKNCKKACNLC